MLNGFLQQPIYLLLLLALVLNDSLSNSLCIAQEDHTEKIGQVERGLSGLNPIAGEPTWTIEQRMKDYGVPGLSIAVIKDHQVVWSKSYGVMDRGTHRKVDSQTLFQCASISKPVSSFAAFRLVQEGAFSLDDDIRPYLKSWKFTENDFSRNKKVSLSQLVSHRAGLTTSGFLGYSQGDDLPTLIQVLDGTKPANSPAVRFQAAPGDEFSYSGGGYCVLQQMIIDHSQRPYWEFMQQQVLQPLNMKHSTFQHPIQESKREFTATGHLPNGDSVGGHHHVYPEMAAAGLWSTAPELAAFVIELQSAYQGRGNRLISQELAKRMVDQELGIFRRRYGGEYYFGHGGWNEGFCSDFRAHCNEGYGVVVLTNANQPEFIEEVINSVARTYEWAGARLPVQSVDLDTEAKRLLTGRYNLNGQLVNVILDDDGRLFLHLFGANPVELIHVGDNKFVQRKSPNAIQFSETDGNQRKFNLVPLDDPTAKPVDTAHGLDDNTKLPFDWLLEKDYEKAVAAFQELKRSTPQAEAVSENYLNEMGYFFLNGNQSEIAIMLFRVNTELYPNAFNTWDSLGEAYLKTGDEERAKRFYQESLRLNPDNHGAKTALKKLEDQS